MHTVRNRRLGVGIWIPLSFCAPWLSFSLGCPSARGVGFSNDLFDVFA